MAALPFLCGILGVLTGGCVSGKADQARGMQAVTARKIPIVGGAVLAAAAVLPVAYVDNTVVVIILLCARLLLRPGADRRHLDPRLRPRREAPGRLARRDPELRRIPRRGRRPDRHRHHPQRHRRQLHPGLPRSAASCSWWARCPTASSSRTVAPSTAPRPTADVSRHGATKSSTETHTGYSSSSDRPDPANPPSRDASPAATARPTSDKDTLVTAFTELLLETNGFDKNERDNNASTRRRCCRSNTNPAADLRGQPAGGHHRGARTHHSAGTSPKRLPIESARQH